ncbi:hypothetical protein ACQZ48_23350, partial [Agrobacterium sp. 22-209-1]
TGADFRGEFVRRLACHRPYFSRVGVSGKSGAVHTVVAINPETVTAVTRFNGLTTIYLMSLDSDGKGLKFAITEDYEFVCKCLTMPDDL